MAEINLDPTLKKQLTNAFKEYFSPDTFIRQTTTGATEIWNGSNWVATGGTSTSSTERRHKVIPDPGVKGSRFRVLTVRNVEEDTQPKGFSRFDCYIDEDLALDNTAIYSFYSQSRIVLGYVDSTGPNPKDWLVSIAYYYDFVPEPNGIAKYFKIVTLSGDGTINLELDSKLLPGAFNFKYYIQNLEYKGSGQWSGLAIDSQKREPVYGRDSYDPFTPMVLYYSEIPHYSFSWGLNNTSNLPVINEAIFSHTDQEDVDSKNDEGVLKYDRTFNYELTRTYRVDGNTKLNRKENLDGSYSLVHNTNGFIASGSGGENFGTDRYPRAAQSKYDTQGTVWRTDGSLSLKSPVIYLGQALGLYYNTSAPYKGKVDYKYFPYSVTGHRGVTYGSDNFQKSWYAYGKVRSYKYAPKQYTYKFNSQFNFRYAVTLFTDPPGTCLIVDGKRICTPLGTYIPNGVLITDKNSINTVFEAFTNPESGLFGITQGEFIWTYVSDMPPFFGQPCAYHFQRNPASYIVPGQELYSKDSEYTDTQSKEVEGYKTTFNFIQSSLRGTSNAPNPYIQFPTFQDRASRLLSNTPPEEVVGALKENAYIFLRGFSPWVNVVVGQRLGYGGGISQEPSGIYPNGFIQFLGLG